MGAAKQFGQTPGGQAAAFAANPFLGAANMMFNKKSGGGGIAAAGPRPTMPTFNSLRDPKTGLLANENYRLKAGEDIKLNTQGLEAIRGRALGTGPSAWAGLAEKKQGLEEAAARDRAAAGAAAGAAQARSSLASRRGLSGGAAERIAQNSSRDLLNQRQGVAQQGQMARANIGLQDETQKMDLLKQLPGMELAALDPQFKNRAAQMDTQRYNIDQALKDKYAEDQAKQNEYQEQMKAWAAQSQANSIMNAGGGKK